MATIKLPWNSNIDVNYIENLSDLLRADKDLKPELIPSEVILLADENISICEINSFINKFISRTKEAHAKWLNSISYLDLKGLFSYSEIFQLLNKNYDQQSQIIYLTKTGSLQSNPLYYSEFNDYNVIIAGSGIIQKTGLFYVYNSESKLIRSNKSYFITSVKPDGLVDWELFTAHDSAHVAFAPVNIALDDLSFGSKSYTKFQFGKLNDISEMSINDLAKMQFGMVELVVAGLNQQGLQTFSSDTQTGLTVFESVWDLVKFAKFAKILFPNMGFEETQRILIENDYYFERKSNNLVITELCAPCLKVLNSVSCSALTSDFMDFYSNCKQLNLQLI